MADNSKYLNLRDVIKILKKRIIIIILITVIIIPIAIVYRMYFNDPVYETRGSLIIGSANDKVEEIQKDMPTYVMILKTNIVAQKTIDELSLDASAFYLQRQLSVIPEPDTQFIEVTLKWHDFDEAQAILDKLIEVFISEGSRIFPAFSVQVLDSIYPYKIEGLSGTLYYLIIGIFAGFIGLFVIFIIEFLDNTIKTEQDFENNLMIPVIGTIPKNKKTYTGISKIVDLSSSLVVESFRTLRTNLFYFSKKLNIKTIVITSARHKESKSTVASMLAVVLANSGKRTLLVDCDLRNPAIHRIFSMPKIGLTNILMADARLSDTILESQIENLYIIPAGIKPLNSVELLSSDRMKELILSFKPDYDYIILDTPPVGLVTEAQVLSNIADGYIMVVSAGETDKNVLLKAQKLIQYADGRIIGAILNKLPQYGLDRRYNQY